MRLLVGAVVLLGLGWALTKPKEIGPGLGNCGCDAGWSDYRQAKAARLR